jgi:hypothetical protein
MYRITVLVLATVFASVLAATAERIKRKPPGEDERARLASEQVLNDGDLRRGTSSRPIVGSFSSAD